MSEKAKPRRPTVAAAKTENDDLNLGRFCANDARRSPPKFWQSLRHTAEPPKAAGFFCFSRGGAMKMHLVTMCSGERRAAGNTSMMTISASVVSVTFILVVAALTTIVNGHKRS